MCAHFSSFLPRIFICPSLAHYILWKGGIQHGDISVLNLMHRNGTGVLNDFDLAPLPTAPGNLHSRRFDHTGTTLFLALDLLKGEAWAGKVERRYRHDLESFLWVLMWITACYDDGVETIPASHRRLLNEDVKACLAGKSHMLRDPNVIFRCITTSYASLTVVTMILREYWADLHSQWANQMHFSALDRFVQSAKGLPPSQPVILEPSDEEVLLNMLRVFTSQPDVDLRPSGLLDDLPLTLFPANSSGLSN